jgi:hypothetical protein
LHWFCFLCLLFTYFSIFIYILNASTEGDSRFAPLNRYYIIIDEVFFDNFLVIIYLLGVYKKNNKTTRYPQEHWEKKIVYSFIFDIACYVQHQVPNYVYPSNDRFILIKLQKKNKEKLIKNCNYFYSLICRLLIN